MIPMFFSQGCHIRKTWKGREVKRDNSKTVGCDRKKMKPRYENKTMLIATLSVSFHFVCMYVCRWGWVGVQSICVWHVGLKITHLLFLFWPCRWVRREVQEPGWRLSDGSLCIAVPLHRPTDCELCRRWQVLSVFRGIPGGLSSGPDAQLAFRNCLLNDWKKERSPLSLKPIARCTWRAYKGMHFLEQNAIKN